MHKKYKSLKIAFFGTPGFAVQILEKLKESGLTPSLIITTPSKSKGRNLILTHPETMLWGQKNKVKVLQPEKLRDEKFLKKMSETDWDLFIVASYGKIIPKEILAMPKYGTLNVHPSLLPRLRGASPIQSAILKEDKTGVTIMLMDEEMDHGPILMQEELNIENWPPKITILENMLAKLGGELLVQTIPQWVNKDINARHQDHSEATYIDKINKEDGLIDFNDDAFLNYRKIQAFEVWPKPYFFTKRNNKDIRVIIKDANFKDGELIITRVLPEGKKEMDYQDFLRGNK